MTQPVKETIDKYDWMLDLYGRKRFAEEKKQYGEERELRGIEKTKQNIALNMLNEKYQLDEISRMTGMNMADILQLAKDNNLLDT